MTDPFHSADITPNGISIKVGTHRRAIGIGDYDTKAEFIAAVAALLKDTLGDRLALVAANVAAQQDTRQAEIDALKAEHAARCAKLEADIATLGTKEEAVAIRRAQERTRKLEQLAALTAELRADEPEPADSPR